MINQNGNIQERVLLPPAHTEYAHKLLRWVYVIEQKKFVHLDDLSIRCDTEQFNEIYSPTQLPQHRKPDKFIRIDNKATNVVFRMDCLPLSKELICPDDLNLPVLNVFKQPPDIPPDSQIKSGHQPVIELIKFLAGGNKDSVRHILKWLAHVYCRPEKRMHHGLLIAGNQGTGKSTIGEIMKLLCGAGTKVIGPKQLKARFNTWMLDTRLVIVEEIREGGDYGLYNKIKTNFTDDKLIIEPKNKDEFYIQNHINYLMFSNSSIPISVDADDRRIFFVWDRTAKKQPGYYRGLRKKIFEEGGVWAFGRYLRDEILPHVPEDFATLPPPISKAHAELAVAGANPIEVFLKEKLEEGKNEFAPKVFFKSENMRHRLTNEECLKAATKNTVEFNDILRRYGYQTGRKELNGKKTTYGWFDRDGWGAELQRMFSNGNSSERKCLLREHYYEINPFIS